MIELTETTGKRVWFNSGNILTVNVLQVGSSGTAFSEVHMIGGETFYVCETAEEIAKLMKQESKLAETVRRLFR